MDRQLPSICIYTFDRKLNPIWSKLLVMICIAWTPILADFPSISAQKNIDFIRITSEDGLSNNNITSLLQDQKGFIWIGTANGLNRYDGYGMTVFKEDHIRNNSLRGNWINCVYEDSQHRLWVGTDKGLNLVDQKNSTFEFISLHGRQEPSEFYEVIRVEEDLNGKLWLATRVNGVIRLGREKVNGQWPVKQYLHEPDNVNSLVSNRIRDIAMIPPNSSLNKGSAEDLFIVTLNGRHLLNTVSERIERLTHGADISTWAEYEVETTKLLQFSKKHGFNPNILLRGSTNLLGPNAFLAHNAHLFPSFEYTGSGPFPKYLKDLALTKGNQLWACDFQGLYKYDLVTRKRSVYYHEPLREWSLSSSNTSCLLVDSEDNLWIGTSSGGVNLLPNTDSPFEHYFHDPENPGSISENHVGSIILDDQRNLWVRFDRRNIDKLQYFPDKGWIRTQSLPLSVTQFFKTRKGKILMASLREGLIEVDPQNGQKERLKNFERDSIYDIYFFVALHADQRDRIWLGPVSPIGLYKWESGQFENIKKDPQCAETVCDKTIAHIFEDQAGHLWFSTDRGLYVFDLDMQLVRTFTHDSTNPLSIAGSKVWSVTEDSKGMIWISTNDGLNRFDPENNQMLSFFEGDGLPNNVSWGVLEDDLGHIWVSTNDGLARSNIDLNKDFAAHSGRLFRTFKHQSDGITGNFTQGAFWKDNATGQLFFGGTHGIHIVHPDRIKVNTTQPSIVITSFTVFGNSEKRRDDHTNHFATGLEKIELDHLDDVVTFTCSDLNFRNPNHNEYQYKLLGLSDQWIPLRTDKTITFIDLKPGTYSLMMKGLSADDIEIRERKILEISVLPPWWQTTWAYLAYGLSSAGLLYLGYRLQLERQLEKQESQRIKELDRFKSRLYTNITHEFRTPLTVILGMAEQLERDSSPRTQQKLSFIRRNGRSLLNLINQMLELSKLENNQLKINYIQGDAVAYVKYIAESFHSFANAGNVMLRVFSKIDRQMMDYDPEKMRQILSNLISNAIKHTNSGGRVHINMEVANSKLVPHLLVEITDTGSGIRKEALPKIFDRFYQADDQKAKTGGTGIGLALTQELIKLLEGSISVQSEVGKGTTFAVRLPISNSAPQKHFIDNIQERQKDLIQYSETAANVKKWRTSGLKNPGKPKLLIVEDNADVIEYLASCLENQYWLAFAYNGQAGIDQALESVPDIIISDVMMPEKDGFEVCDFLKNDERSSHIPIVLLTAKADVESRIDGLSRGADAYLAKPFHSKELTTVIRNLLSIRQKLQEKYRKSATQYPSAASSGISQDPEDLFLNKLRAALEEHLGDAKLQVEDICKILGMGRSNLYAKLSAVTGMSFNIYLRTLRLNKAKDLLLTTDLNVSETAYEVGFNDPKYFSRVFSKQFGIAPSQLQAQA